ncbi:hypothetical protein RY831_27020 [Noviherbaspirillum sp. CPCC 100848]|uniref:Uncharacterized protein n=1 Tax=Noviherbaspirillum album TaxID=3080276 RepID=A0ABU6JGM4_9BURK|nr:hypothetical protein [Noviherbaspirillum sp. CPCC 100848]MEC4722816.1 hypothetical protein [Noviherbaspirillum sp. CPCC 100848]
MVDISNLGVSKKEGIELQTGAGRSVLDDETPEKFLEEPILIGGHHIMRAYQEERLGQVNLVTTFKHEEDILRISKSTFYDSDAGMTIRNGAHIPYGTPNRRRPSAA